MPDDARTVPVTLNRDPDTAAALADPTTRARVGARQCVHPSQQRSGRAFFRALRTDQVAVSMQR